MLAAHPLAAAVERAKVGMQEPAPVGMQEPAPVGMQEPALAAQRGRDASRRSARARTTRVLARKTARYGAGARRTSASSAQARYPPSLWTPSRSPRWDTT